MGLYSDSYFAGRFRDRREPVFFILLFAVLFVKFYFLEYSVSRHATRYLASAASSAGVILILTVTFSLLWRKIRGCAALVLDFLMTLLVLTDLLHLRYYSDMFTFMNIGLSTQVGEIADSVAALIRPADFLYFADIPLFIFFIYLSRNFTSSPFFKKITARRLIFSIVMLIAGVLAVWYRFDSYQKKVPGVLSSMWDRPAVCNNVGALTYHLADARNAFVHFFFKEKLPDEQLSEIRKFCETRNNGRLPGEYAGTARGRNLIIIQVESLQQFVVDLKINGIEVTPNLNRFARGSAYFSNVYNQTALGNSSDAEFMVNTGLYPSARGVAYKRFARNRYEALPRIMAENGYTSLALHGDRPGFWNRNRMYPAMGFDKFISKNDFTVDENIGMGLSDASFFRQSLDILDKTEKPFYAFMITLTSHYPYSFEGISKAVSLDTGPFEGNFMGNYLKSMKYFDDQFGKFIDGLRERGLLDSSVIAVYGDHTAIPNWDRASLEKLLSGSLKSDWEWKKMQKIPVMIRIPGGAIPPGEITEPAGLIDLPETLADLLGLRSGIGFGRDLFGKYNGEPVIFRNGSFIIGDVFVEPSSGRATDMSAGKAEDYSKYAALAEEVKKRLGYSDMILEHDLIPELTGADR